MWKNLILLVINNPKKNWAALNKLLNRNTKTISNTFNIGGTNCSDPQTIANSFNDYFLSHPIDIHNNIQPSATNYSSKINSPVNSVYFEPITDSEIKNEIRTMKKDGGTYDISAKFLKLSINYVCTIIVAEIV